MEAVADYIDVSTIKNSSSMKEKIEIPKSLRVLRDGEKTGKNFGILRVITIEDGDKRVVWDKHDLSQINDAKAMFDELVATGLVPYRVGLDGKATSEVMDRFDPATEELIFLPIGLVTGG